MALPNFDTLVEETPEQNPVPNFDSLVEEPQAPLPAPKPEPMGDTARGFNVSFRQVPPLAKGTLGLVGALGEKLFGVGASLRDYGLKGYQEGMAKLRPFEKENDSATTAWKKAKEGDVGALVDWGQYWLGYLAGQAAETVAVSGLGALAGGAATAETGPGAAVGATAGAAAGLFGKTTVKAAAKNLIEKAVAFEVLRTARNEALKKGAALTTEQAALALKNTALRKSAGRQIGAVIGLLGNSTMLELGEIYPSAVAQAKTEGRELSGTDLARVLGAGVTAGTLDAVSDKLGIDLVTGKFAKKGMQKGLGGFTRAAGRAAGIGGVAALAEGATEGTQTALERFGAGTPLTDDEAIKEYIDTVAVGALGGKVIGGGGALVGETVTGLGRRQKLLSLREYKKSPTRAALLEISKQLREPLTTETTGAPDASEVTSTTEMGVRSEGQGVGGTPPLQQPGQTPVAQTPKAPPVVAPPPVEPAKKVVEPNFLTPEGIPVWEMEVDPATLAVLPNFKKYSDPVTGVIPGKELKGPYNRFATPRISVWERKDGSRLVITGRHKLDLAKREKLKDVPIQLVREVDGWTENMAKIKDVEQNIQDNQGTIYDYAKYFREFKALTYEIALKRGLFRNTEAGRAFRIARNASEQTFSQWYSSDGRDLSDEHALAIANAAPNNEPAQALGRQRAAEGSTPESAANQARRAATTGILTPQTGTLPGFEEEKFDNLRAEEDAAAIMRREIRQDINAIRGAGKKPELARKYGIDVNNPEAVNQKVAELTETLKDLEGDWWLKGPIAAQVRQRAGTEKVAAGGKVEPAPPVPPEAKPKSPQQIALESKQEKLAAERKVLEERLRNIFKKPPGAQSGPLDPDQVDEVMKLGAMYARNLIQSGSVKFSEATLKVKEALPEIWDNLKEYWHAIWLAAVGRGAGADRPTPQEADKIIDEVSGVAGPAAPEVPYDQRIDNLKNGKLGVEAYFDWRRDAKNLDQGMERTDITPYQKLLGLAGVVAKRGRGSWDEVTQEDIIAWRATQEPAARKAEGKKPLKPSVLNQYLNFVQDFLKYRKLIKEGGVEAALVKRRVREITNIEGKQDYISKTNLERLFPANEPNDPKWLRMRAFGELYYATGLRSQDVARLTLDQLKRLDEGILENVLILKQNLNAREVPISEVAVYWLKRYLAEGRDKSRKENWVFPGEGKRGHLSGDTILEHLQQRADKLGIKLENGGAVTIHSIRRTISQDLQDQLGFASTDIDRIIPHADKSTTEKFYLSRGPDWMEKFGRAPSRLEHNRLFLERQKGVVPNEKAKEEKAVLALNKPESVEEQTARLALEEAAQAKKAQEEKLAAEAAKPLTGKVGDIGQGDLLGGGDLFSPPSPETPRDLQPPALFLNTETGELGWRITSDARVAREVRYDNPADLLAALDSPSLNLKPQVRATLKALLTSRMATNAPAFTVAITDYIMGESRGEYLPGRRLLRFVNWADSSTPVHEFLHHLFYYLRPEDRDFIRSLRYRMIGQELGKARNYAEIEPLEKLLKKTYSSDEFLDEAKFPRSLYHLANESEFFVWMMQDKATQHFTQPEERGFIASLRTLMAQLYRDVKRFFGLSEREDNLWRDLVDGRYNYSTEQGREFGRDREAPPLETPVASDEEIANAKLKFAQSEIPRLVKKELDELTQGVTDLEQNAYETKRYRAAKAKIDELVTSAVNAARNSGDEFWEQPDALPTPTDPELANKLEALGINFNREALQAMQADIAFENKAKTLFSNRQKLRRLQADQATLASVGVVDVPELTKSIERIIRAIFRAESDLDVDNSMGITIDDRAKQIEAAAESRAENQAKAATLNLPYVRETFVDPMAANDQMFERFGRTLQAFKAAMEDPTVENHYKAAIGNQFLRELARFSENRRQFALHYESQRQEIIRSIRDLETKMATAKEDYGLAEILAKDALETANGAKGLMGSWRNKEAAEYLLNSYTAIINFAEALRTEYPNGGAQALLTRVLLPNEGRSATQMLREILAGTDEELQRLRNRTINDDTLARLIYVLNTSDEFADAFNAILSYGKAKLALDPTRRLADIATLLESKDEMKMAEAKDKVNRIVWEANRDSNAAQASMKYIAKDLRRAQIALQALEYGKGLFESVTTQSEFYDLKRIAEKVGQNKVRMIFSTGGENFHNYGAVTTVFHYFKVKTGDVDIDQPTLDHKATDLVFMHKERFAEIKDWFDKAKQYVTAYEEAEAIWRNDPLAKSPDELGFETRVYRGLLQALEDYPTYQDPIINFFGTKADNSLVEQWLLMSSLFRQYLSAIRQVNGQVARALQTAIIRYGNTMLEVKAISQEYRGEIHDAISDALASHPEFKGDLEQYKIQVFNEVASEGRKFGSPAKAGLPLPVYGKTATSEDIALITALRRYYTELRTKVTEVEGRGIIEETGLRGSPEWRVEVRRAASVGDKGLPMHVNREGDKRIGEIQKVYNDVEKAAEKAKDPTKGVPQATEELGPTATHPIVQFWNRYASSLTRHILDAGREYRLITHDPLMLDAQRAAALELLNNNNPAAIQSVEDAVALITKHFKEGTGFDARQYVTDALFEELSQYNRNASIHAGKMAELQTTEGIGGMSLASEFTRGAQQFMFPSNWYDYGAVTDSDILHLTARVMHEPIMEVSKALERMSSALQSEIEASLDSEKNLTNYRSLREAKRIRKIIQKLNGDFTKTWNLKDPDVNRTGWEFPPDMVKASLLANPPVNIRNIVLGGALSGIWMNLLHGFSQTMAMIQNLRHVAKIVARVPLDLAFSQQSPVGRKMYQLLDGRIRKLAPSAVEWIAENIVDAHIRDVADVQAYGFSLRDPFLESVKRLWRDMAVYQSTEAAKNVTKLTTAWRGVKNVGRTITLAYRQIGSEYFDKIINAQGLAFAGTLEQHLRDVAETYGMAREGLGAFDPADERWVVTPNELSSRLTKLGREKHLAQYRRMLQGADISLEQVLNKYYQQIKADKSQRPSSIALPEPQMFTKQQHDALMRAVLRAFNAGDALNRPTGLSTSKLFRLLATFQGYPSNFLLDFIGQFNGAKNQNRAKQLVMMLPTIFAYAVGAAILGLMSQEMTDWYRRRFQGATKRQITVLTKEFWNNWQNAQEAVTVGLFSTIPLLGDLVLFTRGVVVNNRGYEPTGRILAFGLANSAFNTVRGMWNLRNDGSNAINPLRDFLLQYAALSKEVMSVSGSDYSHASKVRGAEAAMRYRAEQLGFNQEREVGNVKPGLYYTATSGIREDMRVAMMKQDSEGLQSAFSNLVKFYTDKGAPDPEKNALRDVRMMNPILRAFGSKKPTQDEMDQVYGGLTTDQKQAVNKAVSAWDWAAGQLGINFNPVSGTGGGAGAGVGGASGGYAGISAPRSFGGGRSSFVSLRSGASRRPRTYLTRGSIRSRRTRRLSLRSPRLSRRMGSRRRTLRLRRPRSLTV